jgi:hypothetical protein
MDTPHPDAPAAERDPAPPANPVFPETSPHEPAVRPWELELLISGAVVFSLLQLPSLVDDWFAGVQAHLAGRAYFGAFMLYTYVKLIVYTLIACFVTHLGMRAYWVGLIGLESVFPHGVRWDNSSYGPVMTEVYREKIGRLQPRIDAADRFCSILFPLAFTVVALFVFSILILGIGASLAFGVSRLLFGGRYFEPAFVGVFSLAAVIPIGAWIADRVLGARVERGGRGHRMLRRASLAAYYVNAMPIYGTTFMTLISNVRKGARYPAMYALMALLFGFFFVKDIFLGQGLVTTGDHLYLPDQAGVFGIEAESYEDQREPGEVYARTPSIQSDVIRDPYVKLFIPYMPVRHGEAFAERCQGVRPLSRGGPRLGVAPVPDSAAVRTLLDCWARLQPVALNATPIRPDFRFYRHPGTGVRGILAYIPTAGLPQGANLLTVGPAPRSTKDERDRRGRPSEPYQILFWR